MCIEKITEKLVKVSIAMIENDSCGMLSLEQLTASVPDLQANDIEQLYTDCKVAAQVATTLSQSFTRHVNISFEQREKFTDGEYVPDCHFLISWAS